jgi:hypothetical protein
MLIQGMGSEERMPRMRRDESNRKAPMWHWS